MTGSTGPGTDPETSSGGETDIEPDRLPWTFWAALVPGGIMVAFGVRGLVMVTDSAALWSAGRWLVGGNLVHDLVLSPVICLVAWLLARALPDVARGPVQGACVAAGVIGVVAYPLVRGYGITPGEPSFLSRDYLQSVLILWGLSALVAVVVVVGRVVSARRR